MTQALLLFAQSCADSFSAALQHRVFGTLGARGWEVDDCDLDAEGFDPVLSAPERRGCHEIGANRQPGQAHADRVMQAEARHRAALLGRVGRAVERL